MITAIRRIIAKVTGLLTLTGCQNMCRRRKLIPANASALTTAKTGAVAIVIPMITAATSELPMSSHCADVLFTDSESFVGDGVKVITSMNVSMVDFSKLNA